MKAILIDVTAQTVTDVDIKSSLLAMYAAIGCTCVDRIVLDERNDLWIDDEALLQDPQPPKFSVTGFVRPLAGNALICGYNREGSTISTTLTADQVRPMITFWGDVTLDSEPALVVSW